MRAAEECLVQRIGRHPSTAEVAAFLQVPAEQVDRARQAERGFWAGSLDSPDGVTGQAMGANLADPHDEFTLVDAELVVGPAVASLTARERHIIRLRYVNGMTQAEIGAVIGVTQMQVSRLLRDVLAKLRSRIGEPIADAQGVAQQRCRVDLSLAPSVSNSRGGWRPSIRTGSANLRGHRPIWWARCRHGRRQSSDVVSSCGAPTGLDSGEPTRSRR